MKRDGRRALIAGGACEAVAEALRSAASDDAKANISRTIYNLSLHDDGRRALIAGGACEAVAEALRSQNEDIKRHHLFIP